MLRFPKRWPKSDYDTEMSIVILLLFFGSCLFLTVGLSMQSKQMLEGYQKHIDAAGYSVPKSLDLALLWIYESENIPSMNGVYLNSEYDDSSRVLTETDGLTTPNFGWGVVTTHPGFCGLADGPWTAKIIYVVGGKIVKTIEVTMPESSGVYTVPYDTKYVRLEVKAVFDYECEDSYVQTQLFKK